MNPPPYEPRDYAAASGALREILAWIAEPINGGSKQHLRATRNRIVGVIWTANPALFGNMSMRQLARKLGMKPATLSGFTRAARDRFALRNAFHVHDWRRR
jgi:DNA-binding MarR family transcriptional regulator